MSVYQQVYATPSRILGLYRLLLNARHHRAPRNEVEEALMPENLPLKVAGKSAGEEQDGDVAKKSSKRDMVKRSLDEALMMGLLATEGDEVLLHPDLPLSARSLGAEEASLATTFTPLLLSVVNTSNHDLAKALAWYLGQDVYTAPATWQDVDQKYRTDAEHLGMVNARFGQLRDWSRFLGLAWAHSSPDKSQLALVPDPYRQIRWKLAQMFRQQPETALPLAVVIQRLASDVPVLEGGAFRNGLEGNLLPMREPHQLSSSTSNAWLRLQEEGTVRLQYRSDAPAYVMLDGEREMRYTEVTWLAGGTAQ